MMIRTIFRSAGFICLAFAWNWILSGCSDLRTDLPTSTSAGIQVHPDGWKDQPSSPDFHGTVIRTQNWDMRGCRTCHGSIYEGGSSGVSCRTCHTQPAGPENCATCHGGGTNNAAPPKDLSGNTSFTFSGVGAHTVHLQGTGLTTSLSVACGECHKIPGQVYDAGHLDTSTPGRAEVIINSLLGRVAGGTPNYDQQTLKCNNTFCHGNWSLKKSASPYQFVYSDTVMSGANYTPVWNGGSTQGACATCHGNPPLGHAAYTLANCGSCHYKTTPFDIINGSGKIVDKASHMNGRINAFGLETSF